MLRSFCLLCTFDQSVHHFERRRKASDIGIDYPWTSWGWTVIKNPGYQQIRASDIINYQTGGNLGPWSASSLYGHTGVVGKVLE